MGRPAGRRFLTLEPQTSLTDPYIRISLDMNRNCRAFRDLPGDPINGELPAYCFRPFFPLGELSILNFRGPQRLRAQIRRDTHKYFTLRNSTSVNDGTNATETRAPSPTHYTSFPHWGSTGWGNPQRSVRKIPSSVVCGYWFRYD